jgi:uncharacterized protein YjeT (DUF2065 family)
MEKLSLISNGALFFGLGVIVAGAIILYLIHNKH